MEQLFVQVFERSDSFATQMQQQADSYAQTLACTFLAAGQRPPDWLLPSRVGGPQQELNGKPIVPGLVSTGSQITTPAANRNVFFPPAIPSSSIRKLEILNAYTQPVNNFADLGTLVDDQHEEPQQEQTSLNKELANTCAEANMFSRIERSKSRQRNIEDRRRGRDQAANCRSCDGIQAAGSNTTTVLSSSKSCGDVANNAETTSSCPGQANGFYASQGRSTDFLKCHNNLGSQGNHLDCLLSLALEDKIMSSDDNCSARDLQIVQHPEHSELNIVDTMCHTMPETHLLVESQKLQFDGTESVCMGTTSEQTGQQQESALEKDHFCLADRNLLSEDPYPASSSQEQHSMGRSLHGLKSDYLISVNADLKHNQYGLESGHGDLSANSLSEGPSLKCSIEIPSFVGDPLLQKSTLYVTETISKLSQAEEMGPLNSDETKCSERSHSVVNPLLEKDTLQTVENTKKLESSNTKVSPPPSSGPLPLPIQLADASFDANASGMSTNSLLGENGHNHLSKLLKNDTNSRCSLGMSSVSIVQLPLQPFTSNPLSSGKHSNGTHSNGFTAADAFESAENMLLQDQYLLSRPSSVADADAPFGHPPPDIHNKTLIGNPASELVNCHSGKLSADVQVNKNDKFVAPKVISSVSPGRSRKMHKTERSSEVSSEKCNGSLRQEGIEQEIHPVDNDVPINAEACTVENVEHMKSSRSSAQYFLRSSVSYEKNSQLQADRGNARKRSVADGVQVNGGASSKAKRIKCQDVTHSHSSHTNSLYLNNHDGIGSHAVTAEKLSGRPRPSGRYLLRSSGFNEFMSLESETKNAATNSKMSVATENGDISPIKNSHPSNVGICNSSSGEALSPSFNRSKGSRTAVGGIDFRNSQADFQTNFDTTATSVLPICSNIAPDMEECCTQEENLSLEGLRLSVNISNVKHQEMAIQTDENVILVNQENYSGTGPLTMLPSHVSDEHGKQTSDLAASLHDKLSFDSDVKFDMRCDSEDPARFFLSDATILRQEGDESVDCNNILPEFECFDVSLPLDIPTTEKGRYETLCDPRQFGTLSSDISSKYKVNTVNDMHQLVATMSEKATSCPFSGDVRQYSVSSDDNITDIFGSCGLGISGSFLPSDIVVSSSSNDDSDKHVSGENPLTPTVEKYSLGKLSARVGSVSEHMGSIPELSCFRIDEDSGIAEENECRDMLPESVANQVQSGRKALQDITGLCQTTENSALNSLGFMNTSNIDMTTETCSSKLNQNSSLKYDQNNKKPKESGASLVKREGKVSHPLNRLSKTEVSDNRNQRNTSETSLGKRSKPSNIVVNVASFIPLVKPKQSTTCVKKDVRVKALEAAEAAKRLEEKKQNEREMRKAAAKLEREKMKKERESKQKQEQEQKKKRDNDMANKKRQRDEEERREKERKRRCTEEARKHQKQPTERRHASDEKNAHPKASDHKELRKNLVKAERSEVKLDERIDLGNKAITSNNDIVVDERPASFVSHATENIPNSFDESYVMTPYKEDSGDEDDEEEESRHRKKLKPSWVREENLVKILLSDNQALDPREIFAQKCSFNLSDVLPVHVPLRGFK